MTNPRAAAATADSTSPQPVVDIDYWTDPLCCWSWAMEPQWRRLRYEFHGLLRVRYRMGGMIESWSAYSDPLNSISRPFQMGPLWFQAREVSGMPIHDRIWVDDPPASSYLPCVAVKAAELQSLTAAERYLRRLREAVMLHGHNIARQGVLSAVAADVARDLPPDLFDPDTFDQHLHSPAPVNAFREDLKQAAYRNIGRFPTLTLRRAGEDNGLITVGYRPYALLRQTLARLAPELTPSRAVPPTPEAYVHFWQGVLPRELAELTVHAPEVVTETVQTVRS